MCDFLVVPSSRDLGALSLLLTQHINPYGRFDLDLDGLELGV